MENIVKSFARSLGNGIAMGEQLKAAIDHVIKERDTTVIVKLINAAQKKGDKQAESAVKFTFGKIYDGAEIETKKGNLSIRIKNATLSNSAVDTLNSLAGKVSMRGTNWNKAFKGETDKPEFDVQAWAEKQVKARPEQLEAMIAALQAQRPNVKKAA